MNSVNMDFRFEISSIDLQDIAAVCTSAETTFRHFARRLELATMSHTMVGYLGAPRHVPVCVLNAGQPARSAPHARTHSQPHRQSAHRLSRQQKALDAWVLHAVRSDQKNAQVDSSVLQLISDLTNKVDQEHAAILAENEPTLEGIADEVSEGLKLKVEQSIQKLQKGLLERETEVPHIASLQRISSYMQAVHATLYW